MVSELQAAKILAGALVVVSDRRRRLAQSLAIPFFLLLALSIVQGAIANPAAEFLLLPVILGLQTVFAVTTHRLILLGDASVPKWGIASWTRRETIFALHLFAVSFLVTLPLVLVAIPFVGGVIGLVGAGWLGCRTSLVFPAIATDQGVTIPMSWRLSRRHQMPLFISLCTFPLLAIPTVLLVASPLILLGFAGVDPAYLGAVGRPFLSATFALMVVLTFATLSLAYREVIRVEYRAESSGG